MTPNPSCTPDPVLTGASRIDGGVRIAIARTLRGSGIERLSERGGYRARATREGDRCEVFLLNPAGGLAGGDRIGIELLVAPDAKAMATTAAAERVYRSDGPESEVDCRLEAGARSVLEWLPQQTVIYDGSRFRRRLVVEAEPDARVTVLESLALGRRASGERLTDAAIHDHWRIRRGGRLVLAEAMRLVGPVTTSVAHPAIGSGARAMATFVHVAPDAEATAERVRSCLVDEAGMLCGSSLVDGVVVARWLAMEPMALADALQAFLIRWRGRSALRGW